MSKSCGVKQGCPLSPTLFGLFLDGLHRHIQNTCHGCGAFTDDMANIPLLMYADDIALISHSPSGLQDLITATHGYCTLTVGLTISPFKSCVIIFCKRNIAVRSFQCGNSVIPQVSSTKYLGLTLHSSTGLHSACKVRRQNMTLAWVTLQRQYAGLRCSLSFAQCWHCSVSRLYCS